MGEIILLSWRGLTPLNTIQPAEGNQALSTPAKAGQTHPQDTDSPASARLRFMKSLGTDGHTNSGALPLRGRSGLVKIMPAQERVGY